MPQSTRSQIDAALFAQLVAVTWETLGSPPIAQTWAYASMHFLPWENFPNNEPAMFLRRITEDATQARAYGLTKYMMRYEVWVYAQVPSNDPTANPYDVIDPIVDAIDKAVAAYPPISRNTLNNLPGIDNCYLSGQIIVADGTDDGQSVVRIPLVVVTGI